MKNLFQSAFLRRSLFAFGLTLAAATAQAQNNVGVGTPTPDNSAVLDVSSTTQGLLAPRMSQAQRNAIGTPATGLLVYQTDNTPGFYVYSGAAWTAVAGSGPQGPIGNTGPAGAPGTNGTNGAPGAAGAPGTAGTNGTNGTNGAPGNTGPQGPIGNTGAAGAPGTNGTNGAPGAAGAAGAAGPIGNTGSQGPIGNTGVAGAAGSQGPIGNTGAAGAPGATGSQGPIGNIGPAGAPGTNGTNGAPGAAGADGASFYANDGTLTGNRTMTLGGFNLNFGGTGNLGLNDNPLRLRAANDTHNFLRYDASTNGLVLSGQGGGRLGLGLSGGSTALSWSSSGVSINGGTSAFTLPTGRGTSGQTLQSDGAGAVSWITPGAGSVTTQLYATKNVAQTLANANGTNTGDVVTFGNTVAAPTFGTFDGTTFTATTGGTYYIQVHAVVVDAATPSNTVGPWFMVEVNNSAFGSPNNFYGPYPGVAAINFPSGLKGRGQLQAVLRLTAGDTFKIKGLTANSSIVGTNLKTDGSTHLTVLRLN